MGPQSYRWNGEARLFKVGSQIDVAHGYNLGNGRGCPLVVHCSADLPSVHGFRCYDNMHVHIAPNAKCQRVLVLAP